MGTDERRPYASGGPGVPAVAVIRAVSVAVGGSLLALGLAGVVSGSGAAPTVLQRTGFGLVVVALAIPRAEGFDLVPSPDLSPDERRYVAAAALLLPWSWRTTTAACLILWGWVLVRRLLTRCSWQSTRPGWTRIGSVREGDLLASGILATRAIVVGGGALLVVGSLLAFEWLVGLFEASSDPSPEGFVAFVFLLVVIAVVFTAGIGLVVLASVVSGPGQVLFEGPPAAERRLAIVGAVLTTVGLPVDVLMTLGHGGSSLFALGLLLLVIGPLMRAGTWLHRLGKDPQT